MHALKYHKMIKALSTAIIISVQIVFAQEVTPRLDSLFNARYNANQFNGNVLMAESGKVIYQRSFGYADFEKNVLLAAHSRFDLASTSKLFTAVAILQLKEKGKIKLSDPVIKYFPDFPYANITVWHLLTHTSGLPDYQIFEPYYHENPDRILTNGDIIPALKRYKKVLVAPGEKWSYSSPGMALLASIVEKVTKLDFEKYLIKYIWRPSGMHNSYINSLSKWIPDNKRVEAYARPALFSDSLQRTDTMQKHRMFSHMSGALIGPGLVVSDALGLFLFDQALYAGKLLRPETMEEAFSPVKLNDGTYAEPEPFLGKTFFGLGWFILNSDPSQKIVLHTGKHAGIVTIFLRNVTAKQTFILLDNIESFGLNNLTLNALRILNREPLIPLKNSAGIQYAKDLIKYGADFAISHFYELKADTMHYYLNLYEMDFIGHQMLSYGYTDRALETLKILTLIDGQNWFPYYSYGKALLWSGRKKEAAMALNKSLTLNPGNKEVTQLMKEAKE